MSYIAYSLASSKIKSQMETQFVTIQVLVQPSPGEMRRAIEAALVEIGQPLRWATTTLDQAIGVATVEAIVTTAPTT